jgi:Zn-dependent protease
MFSKNEIKDLLISVLALALIFSSFQIDLIPMTLFVVILVFFSHELGHKFLAQHYGLAAEYRMWLWGIILGLIVAILPGGFVFVAPGAVYISHRREFAFQVSRLTRRQYGLINFIGPLINIIVGVAMITLNFFVPLELFILTARVSLFLAMFNLIPIPPLDGSKIFAWDRRLWGLAFAISLIGLFL